MKFLLFFVSFFFVQIHYGQIENHSRIKFQKSPLDQYGLDQFTNGLWADEYTNYEVNGKLEFKSSFKSLPKNQAGKVIVSYLGLDTIDIRNVSISINKSNEKISFDQLDKQRIELKLPAKSSDYTVNIKYNSVLIKQLNVVVYDELVKRISLVPLNGIALNKDSIEQKLNLYCKHANVRFEVKIYPDFSPKELSGLKQLSKSSKNRDQYSNQMRYIRDLFITENPSYDKSIPLFFVVNEFEEPLKTEYGVKNKALGFVAVENLSRNLLRLYLTGPLGAKYVDEEFENRKSVTNNILDGNDGFEMRKSQWELLRNGTLVISYNDDYEHVITNNGIVGYYSWELNEDGTIKIKKGEFLSTINRPFKKNTFSYHLEITSVFYKTLFSIYGREVNLLHIIGILVLLVVGIWLGRKLRKWLKQKYKRSRILRFLSRFVQWGFIWVGIYFYIELIDLGYSMFEVRKGEIKELESLSIQNAHQLLAENMHPRKLEESEICSEIIVKSENQYEMLQRKPVLYFEGKKKGDQLVSLKFKSSSDSLILKDLEISELAKSHYMVLSEKDESGNVKTRIFNHVGIELSKKVLLPDPVKRVLVFVNGYRPTSMGNSLEQNINDIKKKGLEFPDSYNQVFGYDRYNYWHPWNAIDDLFKERMLPNEVYYADGHHSVETSNHRSLLNFSTLSATYPKRCSNPKKHKCYYMSGVKSKILGSKKIETYKAHRTKPNKKGFEKRRRAGRIAGRNILQLLNERPNSSENDTLFIVAHSMGYAYSLGMIEVLRGKINFGDFYILAPENASAGKVNLSEWKTVYQYGSNFNEKGKDKPCLQDGIAPQTACGGLSENERLYIPRKNYKQKGFFDSHFVGYYTWLFTIPEGEKGAVRKH
jgi:hypothetical protein